MATPPALLQLQTLVERLGREFVQEGRQPLTDGSEALLQLCELLERLMLTSKPKKAKTYFLWDFLRDALVDASSTLRAVEAMPQQRTPKGRSRALIRLCLANKTLAETLQVATRNAKATQRWYHRESAMRSPQHSARLVDILYNLNEIDFELDRALSLDDAWPSFAPRSFSGGAGGMLSPLERSPFRSRGPGSAVSGPGGLNSSFGSGRASDNISLASGSAVDFDQISYTSLDHSQLQNLEQLQSEKELAEQEKKAAIEDKEQAEAAWNDMVVDLKQQVFELKEALARAEQQAQQDRLAVDAIRAKERSSEPAKGTTKEEAKAPPSEESAERTADRHMAELKQQCSELEQQLETERRLRLEADTGRREAEERIASSSQSVEAELARLREEVDSARENQAELAERLRHLQDEKHHMEEQHIAELAQLRQQKATEIETLETLHAEDRRAISELTSSLQAAERARASAVARIGLLEQNLAEVSERLEASEEQAEMFRLAVMKVTNDKMRLWTRTEEVRALAAQVSATASGTWQSDSEVQGCPTCDTQFSFTVRRHHCRCCGKIYCNTCTSSMAKLSGSKRAERICMACDALLGNLKEQGQALLQFGSTVDVGAAAGASANGGGSAQHAEFLRDADPAPTPDLPQAHLPTGD